MKKLSKMEKDVLSTKIEELSIDELIDELRSTYKDIDLGPTYLGKIFEKISEPVCGVGKEFSMQELREIHKSFHTTNGGGWCRSDNGYLAERYKIKRGHTNGNKITSVKLDGENKEKTQTYKNISIAIKKSLKNERCVILDVKSNIEIDHKNGKYNDRSNESMETQKMENFQPLSKAANNAKRQHCKECRNKHKRYDAKRLGYSESFLFGDEDSPNCEGCYWYDPKAFNREISKDYKKER